MRFRTIITFIFIFITWYTLYQMFFSYIITLAFVLSVSVVFWLLHITKKIKNKFTTSKKKKRRLILRGAT